MLLAVAALSSASAAAAATNANVGWGGFGNTADENRHSPLAQINTGNVGELGRLYTVDFRQIDSTVRKGEQSYPVVQGDTMYMTTNDDNVWALNATTGAVKWRWTPQDVAVFADYGVVANRGVALCDGNVYVLTLDMNVVALDAKTGKLEHEVPISQAVPGADVRYGYSETSAPICYDHTVIFGAAGSEYGVRGFVMAYHTNLTPAWPNAFWTIPPAGTEWRRFDTLAGGGVVWTPVTVDPKTDTLYFGTGSATPLYFPSVRPGPDGRADSLVAVDLKTGRMKWWQQQMSFNEWSYDTSQPPLVYTGKVGGKTERVVSVATMEGLWFAYDAATGRPIYSQVKVLDHTEHPKLRPGKPVVVYPSSIGGFNYSPASYDPTTDYVLSAAAETAAIDTQSVLTPSQKKDKFTLGDVFLGLQNGTFGQYLPGYQDYGSISAINVNTGTVAWKDKTPQPERGGITTTAGGIGFDGDGDGVMRAFNTKTGKILWTFQTGAQIASGPSVYSVGGKEYVAITVGGTPTSSSGGTATQLQVFALGASTQQSSAPVISATTSRAHTGGSNGSAGTPSHKASTAPHRKHVAASGHARIVTGAPVTVRPWNPNLTNVQTVTGTLKLNGVPVSGARVVVDHFPVAQPTGKAGGFSYDLDDSVSGRHVIHVVDVKHARINGKPLTAGQKRAVLHASGGFTSAFAISGLKARVQRNGTVRVTGVAQDSAHHGPPPVHLVSYDLSGRVTDAQGNGVKGAIVITRTQDRDFWTRSNPSDANGYYTSFFPASDESGADPVTFSVGVAVGDTAYGGVVGTNMQFARLKSAVMNVQLGAGTDYTLSTPQSYTTSIQAGLAIGVRVGGKVVVPTSARWPDRSGHFSMVLPASARGHKLDFFENQVQVKSSFVAKPGGPVDIKYWPKSLAGIVPQGVASLMAPSH